MSIALHDLRQAVTAPWRTARAYSLGKLRHDALAGLTVAVVAVPQSMAYALIAGVDPVYGLYTVIVQSMLGAIFAASPYLSVGPINTQSLLTAAIVSRITGDPAAFLPLAVALTLLKGLIQMAMAAGGLGQMVRYVSQSVLIGFTAGAGVLIAVGQVPNFLGLAVGDTARTWPGVLGAVQQVWPHLHQVQPQTVTIGAVALLVMLAARRASRFAPAPLLAVVAASLLFWAMAPAPGAVTVIGELPRSLASFTWPQAPLQHLEPLLQGALALALLGLMEAYSIARRLADRDGASVSANAELFSQGFTNLVSSFFQCIPGSGSFSRSALNYHAGARTSLSGVFNGLFVLTIFLALAPLARYVPLASLAAILFVVAFGLIDWRYLVRVARSDRSDALVCLATFLATLLLSLEYAIFVGVFLNIALYLRRAARLHLAEVVGAAGGGAYLERPLHDRAGQKKVMFLQVEGDLFFGVADELQQRLGHLAQSPVRVVILRLKRTHLLDSTVLMVLEGFVRQMQARGGHVLLCGVRPELMQTLRDFGLLQRLGTQNVFETRPGVFTSAKEAIGRARELLGASIDQTGLDWAEEDEGWAYQI